MTRRAADPSASAASELASWFHDVAESSRDAFGWGADPRGQASVLHVLRRQSARVRTATLARDGSDYTALCLFLAAAAETLRLAPADRHWRAALRNVAEQSRVSPAEPLGLELGTPAQRFKLLLDDALDAAGLGSTPTFLDGRNRELALGLALNWGLRTLLAYAAEAHLADARPKPGRRDLAWIRSRVRDTRPAA